jgi:hypothetical protein
MAASSVSFGRLEAWQVGAERESRGFVVPWHGYLLAGSVVLAKRFRAEVDYGLFYEHELVSS